MIVFSQRLSESEIAKKYPMSPLEFLQWLPLVLRFLHAFPSLIYWTIIPMQDVRCWSNFILVLLGGVHAYEWNVCSHFCRCLDLCRCGWTWRLQMYTRARGGQIWWQEFSSSFLHHTYWGRVSCWTWSSLTAAGLASPVVWENSCLFPPSTRIAGGAPSPPSLYLSSGVRALVLTLVHGAP